MSPGFATFIMMNNYFHDVATAMIGASGFLMYLLIRIYDQERNERGREKLILLYRWTTAILKGSLIWLIGGAIPRALTFRSYEWANAVNKGQETGLLAKQLVAFVMITAGTILWIRVSGRMKKIKTGR
ncbi:MAG: hypothetical protein D6726_00800 [Nitrospirae bacterium]|nr:MAG: hypothetical protein D6726_00800 [Nitrospirota bacterium]